MSMFLVCRYGGSEFVSQYVDENGVVQNVPFTQAMCMMALVLSGLVMLYRVCQPINGYRLVLFMLMTALSIMAMALPPIGRLYIANALCSNWDKLEWNYAKILIVVVAIEAALPLSSWFIKIMQIIMPSSTSNDTSKKSGEDKKKRAAK